MVFWVSQNLKRSWEVIPSTQGHVEESLHLDLVLAMKHFCTGILVHVKP